MKQMQSEQRRMNAEMNRRSKEYSNQIVSQKLQNKDHKLQELIQQRMSTSNINFQKSIRMDAIKATEDPREKRRLMKLYFGVE